MVLLLALINLCLGSGLPFRGEESVFTDNDRYSVCLSNGPPGTTKTAYPDAAGPQKL